MVRDVKIELPILCIATQAVVQLGAPTRFVLNTSRQTCLERSGFTVSEPSVDCPALTEARINELFVDSPASAGRRRKGTRVRHDDTGI